MLAYYLFLSPNTALADAIRSTTCSEPSHYEYPPGQLLAIASIIYDGDVTFIKDGTLFNLLPSVRIKTEIIKHLHFLSLVIGK